MKKILSTMLVGALIAGAAFADISFDYTGVAILTGRNHAADEGKEAKSSLKQLEEIFRNDCLSLSISNDVAGVVCDWDIHSTDADTSINKKGTATQHEGTVMELDSFYGWMTFGLPVGNLQITSGKWTSRYVNRVNSAAGNLDAYNNYFERFKPGNIAGGLAADSDNLTEGNYSTVLAYTLADTLPGTLMVKFGLVNSNYNDPDNSASGKPEVTLKSGFVGEVCWFQENLIKANVAVKNYVKGATSLGIFVSPLMVAGLDATVGFSTAIVDSDWVKDYSEIAFDLRARYAVSEKTGITGMFNYSNAGIKDNDKTAMWTMLGIDYAAGENIKFVAALNNTVNDFDAELCKDSEFAFSAGCDVQASEKATVSVGFDMNWTNAKPFSGTADVSVPISVSFSL
ncbi:MAG: hypothetical protein IJL34_04730 [Treponema sp.]|nr:hypothetical protein [Treponema sp.]